MDERFHFLIDIRVHILGNKEGVLTQNPLLPQKRHAQSLIGKTHIHDRSRMLRPVPYRLRTD
jgi:hypothetical protein